MAKPTRRGVYPITDTPYQFAYKNYIFNFPSMPKMKRFIHGKDIASCSLMGKQMRKEADFFNWDLAEYSLIMWYYECQKDNFCIIEVRDGGRTFYTKWSGMPKLKMAE